MMNKISCNVCMDLIPLVNDNVASEDSMLLVTEHIADCTECKASLENDNILDTPMDNKKVIAKIKAKLALFLVAVIIGGALLGMIISDGLGLFYNALIFPLIGGIGYLFFKKWWYLVPIGLFALTFIWTFLRDIFNGYFTVMGIAGISLASAMWSLMFATLGLLGSIIAMLLGYAFKKEERR